MGVKTLTFTAILYSQRSLPKEAVSVFQLNWITQLNPPPQPG